MTYKTDGEVPSISFAHVGQVCPPYNSSIAELSLRPNANRPDPTYPFHVSATFGSDVIKLNAGNTEFEVIFEIYQAEIVIHQSNTRLHFGAEFHEQNKIYKQARRDEVTERFASEGVIGISTEGIKSNVRKTKEYSRTELGEFLDIKYTHGSLEHIKIGNRNAVRPLEGQVVRDYGGWLAEPQSADQNSGIRVDLNVRESWVRMRDPKTESKSKLGELCGWIFNSDRKEHRLKKELFADLLRKLTFLRLQPSGQTQTATLHSAAIICTPVDGVDLVPAVQAEPLVVEIDESDLLEFLRCEPGSEKRTMQSILHRRKPGRTAKRAFVPHSNVRSALRTYEYISDPKYMRNPKTKAKLEERIGRNEIKDLMAAGLAIHEGNKIKPIHPYPNLDPESAFKVQVASKSTIGHARDLLVEDPSLSPVEIGIRVAKYLERDWQRSSCKSNGHRLRSWAAFAFGDLLLDASGRPFHLSMAELSEHGPKIGRFRFMNTENLSLIAQMKARGMTIAQMAKELDVAAETIRKWKRDNPEEWDLL